MWIHRPIVFAVLTAAAFSITPAVADTTCNGNADIQITDPLPYSGSGCLQNDESLQSFLFTVDSSISNETLDLYTTSWATGGFYPTLWLFGPDGSYVDSAGAGDPNGGTCGARVLAQDGDGAYCADAYLVETNDLTAGAYRLVLTEFGEVDNQDNNGYVSDPPADFLDYGYSQDFTSFNTGLQLTNQWAVTIALDESSAPEPTTGLLGLSGVLFALLVARQRRSLRSQN